MTVSTVKDLIFNRATDNYHITAQHIVAPSNHEKNLTLRSRDGKTKLDITETLTADASGALTQDKNKYASNIYINSENLIVGGKIGDEYTGNDIENGQTGFFEFVFNSKRAIQLPRGTSADRPDYSADNNNTRGREGQIRYNTELQSFEGHNGAAWNVIGGLIDVDKDTFIEAENRGADGAPTNNNQLRFFTGDSAEPGKAREIMRILGHNKKDADGFDVSGDPLQDNGEIRIGPDLSANPHDYTIEFAPTEGIITASGGIVIGSRRTRDDIGGVNGGRIYKGGDYTLVIDPYEIDPTSEETDASGQVIIRGDLIIQGNQTQVNSTIVEISDVSITLGGNATDESNLNAIGDKKGLLLGKTGSDWQKEFIYDNNDLTDNKNNRWYSNISMHIAQSLTVGDGDDGLGSSTSNGQYALKTGSATTATGNNSTAMGSSTTASSSQSVAWGQSTTASTNDNATAWGRGGTASGYQATKFGYGSVADASNSTAWGEFTKARTEKNTTAFGYRAVAEKENATAFGYMTKASAQQSVAWGESTEAKTNKNTTAFGLSTLATGINATAFGYDTEASGSQSVAWGISGEASGVNSTAFGKDTDASGANATAFGLSTVAGGQQSVAWGKSTQAKTNKNTTAFGDSTIATGINATAFGYDTLASGSQSVAWGISGEATGLNSTAFGDDTRAKGNQSVAWGQLTQAKDSKNTTAFGESTLATGANATAFGYDTEASGSQSVAWGISGEASGDHSTAFGYNTAASGMVATAFGTNTVARGQQSVAFGYNTDASGLNSTAWGYYTDAFGLNSTAFGYDTLASGSQSVAWGISGEATGLNSTAFGDDTRAGGQQSVAWGESTQANTNKNTTAFGESTLATGANATAFGYDTEASGSQSVAWGISGEATGVNSTAFGKNSLAKATESTAFGVNTKAYGVSSTAWGKGTITGTDGGNLAADNSTAFGLNTRARGHQCTSWGEEARSLGSKNCTAFGYQTYAQNAEQATAFGYQSIAQGENATAFGKKTFAEGNNSTAFGEDVSANALNSTAWGQFTQAMSNKNTTAFGQSTLATGENATAFGLSAKARGTQSVAWGQLTEAKDNKNTTAFGQSTLATGENATAFGYDTLASANQSVAWGISGEATGVNSTAFGNNTDASGTNATAFGLSTVAGGQQSVAWGNSTQATGNNATAFGNNSQATANNTNAIGYYTLASGPHCSAFGQFNVDDRNKLFMVGSGMSNTGRRTALSVNFKSNTHVDGNFNLNKSITTTRDEVKLPVSYSSFSVKKGSSLKGFLISNSDRSDISNTWIKLNGQAPFTNFPDKLTPDYHIEITPTSKRSKIALNYKINYVCSHEADQTISFRVRRTITIDDTEKTEHTVFQDLDLGTAMGVTASGVYNGTWIDEPEETAEWYGWLTSTDYDNDDLSEIYDLQQGQTKRKIRYDLEFKIKDDYNNQIDVLSGITGYVVGDSDNSSYNMITAQELYAPHWEYEQEPHIYGTNTTGLDVPLSKAGNINENVTGYEIHTR